MDPITIALLLGGAGFGLLNYGDKKKQYAGDLTYQKDKTLWSPWTGQHGQRPIPPSMFAELQKGLGTGVALSSMFNGISGAASGAASGADEAGAESSVGENDSATPEHIKYLADKSGDSIGDLRRFDNVNIQNNPGDTGAYLTDKSDPSEEESPEEDSSEGEEEASNSPSSGPSYNPKTGKVGEAGLDARKPAGESHLWDSISSTLADFFSGGDQTRSGDQGNDSIYPMPGSSGNEAPPELAHVGSPSPSKAPAVSQNAYAQPQQAAQAQGLTPQQAASAPYLNPNQPNFSPGAVGLGQVPMNQNYYGQHPTLDYIGDFAADRPIKYAGPRRGYAE